MSIDISVLIWTVICFLVLMFALTKLLFKPLLKVMHERQEKIASGIAAGEQAEAELEKRRLEHEEELERLKAEQERELEEKLARVREESARLAAETEKQTVLGQERYDAELKEQEQALTEQLRDGVERLASTLAEKITSVPPESKLRELMVNVEKGMQSNGNSVTIRYHRDSKDKES